MASQEFGKASKKYSMLIPKTRNAKINLTSLSQFPDFGREGILEENRAKAKYGSPNPRPTISNPIKLKKGFSILAAVAKIATIAGPEQGVARIEAKTPIENAPASPWRATPFRLIHFGICKVKRSRVVKARKNKAVPRLIKNHGLEKINPKVIPNSAANAPATP